MPGRTLRKAAPPAAPAGREAAAEECALELARIGDRWDLRQRILNLLAKLFCPGSSGVVKLLQHIQWMVMHHHR